MVKKNKIQKNKHGKRNNNKKNKRNIVLFLIIIIIIIIFKLISSKKNADMKLILDYVDITKDLSNKIFKTEDIVYMSVEDISKYIDKSIYQEDNLIITTSDFKVACIELDSNVININGSNQNIAGVAMRVNENIYLPISELEKVYNIKFNYSKSSNISTVENLNTKKVTAVAKKRLSVKKDRNIFSKTLSKVNKGTTLICISEEGNWTKVMDGEGHVGFVKTNRLKDINTVRDEFEAQQYLEIVSNPEQIEEDITNEDIETFDSRKKIIERLFDKVIESGKKCVKLTYKDENKNWDRLKIEATPIFNECGIKIEFTD